ncbi:nucleoid protein H-NS [Fluviicoccus keumensis]|uniref:Nucleoid protein H-NS n=1 Tax=Fluviicoccus keumensis TaxID=1435465 RepID=A0A4Q7YHE8_9GAMM|nr:H-NS histone family protein [Fluviicoccus keumensis]RZU36942.1 nucleoid protein H-NS [Fluviicoccus keumensis]
MKPDLSQLSISELNAVIAEAQALISARKDEELQKTYQEFAEKARALGMTVDQILAVGAKSGRGKAAPAAEKKPVAIRYRNPANPSETWTGRGKQPRWLAARIAAGSKVEDFAI